MSSLASITGYSSVSRAEKEFRHIYCEKVTAEIITIIDENSIVLAAIRVASKSPCSTMSIEIFSHTGWKEKHGDHQENVALGIFGTHFRASTYGIVDDPVNILNRIFIGLGETEVAHPVIFKLIRHWTREVVEKGKKC
jgi:hypothetical protein